MISLFLFSFQDNNIERAADWIFSHAEELAADTGSAMETEEPQQQYRNGNGSKYSSNEILWMT